MEDPQTIVVKRSGEIVEFDIRRISEAITKAFEAVDEKLEEIRERFSTIAHEFFHLLISILSSVTDRKVRHNLHLYCFYAVPITLGNNYVNTYSKDVKSSVLRAIMTSRLQIGVEADESIANSKGNYAVCF